MTERKPPNTSWESWIEGQIRVSMERGEFDDLPGKGKPIPDLDKPLDDMWWVREKLRREEVSFLPPTLEVRRELDLTRRQIASATDEGSVRELVGKINERIRYVNAHVVEGPPSTVMTLDEEHEVERWHANRWPASPQLSPETPPPPSNAGPTTPHAWRRLDLAAIVFTAAVLFHNSDHLRRGADATPGDVFVLGSLAILVEVAVVAAIYVRHRYAALMAAVVGSALAAGYLLVHFTPERPWFSDSLLQPEAAPISIVAAGLETAAALALGGAGLSPGNDATAPSRPGRWLATALAAMAAGNLFIFVASLVTS